MFLIPCTVRFPCGKTAVVVRVGLERGQLGKCIHPALKRDLRGREQFAVFGGKLVFLLHVLDDLGGEGLFVHLGVHEQQVAVLGFEVLAEGRRKHCFEPFLLVFFDLRTDLVPEFDLAVVEFVARVDRMTDVRQRAHRIEDLFFFLFFKEDGFRLFITRCGFEAFGQIGKRLLDRFGIGSFVRHFRKFHRDLLSVLRRFFRRSFTFQYSTAFFGFQSGNDSRLIPISGSARRSTTPSRMRITISQVTEIIARFRCPPTVSPFLPPAHMCRC